MPYFRATYAANVDKIFATMGPYIVKCNATTGAREAVTKLGAPIHGDLCIAYHAGTGKLFVGAGTTAWPSASDVLAATPQADVWKDVYQVDPSTMAITATNAMVATGAIGAQNIYPDSADIGGIYDLSVSGDTIGILYRNRFRYWSWARLNANTLSSYNDSGYRYSGEQTAIDPSVGASGYGMMVNQYNNEIRFEDISVAAGSPYVGYASLSPYQPVGLCYSPTGSLVWVVCGGPDLLTLNKPYGSGTGFAHYDLAAVSGPTEIPDPCRIQAIGGKLYLPCVGANGIIVGDPTTAVATWEWKSGFETPIDVVSTGSKIFAVQLAPTGLKEIV